jgi:hypothetical protein
MDPLLADSQDGRSSGKRQETAFPAGYGPKIAKNVQDAFLHFALGQINGCPGGCVIGFRRHGRSVLYPFKKVKC